MIDEPLHLDEEEFDRLVGEVMETLPEEWEPVLENMAVVIEEEPSEDEIPPGVAPDTVFGLYRGMPVPIQIMGGGLAGPALEAPPEIVLFQGPLERASATLDDLREHVRRTLVQEIGRRLGFSGDMREGT